jgi:lysophospholipase L1-like esterase
VKLRGLSWRRKLLFAGIIILFFFGVLEIVVRARAWAKYGSFTLTEPHEQVTVYDVELGQRALLPSAEVHSANLSVSINSLGFRGKEITVEKPPRTIRIACVGASTTYCAEVPDAATWPARLQVLLQEKHPDIRIEVLNVGVPGYTLVQSHKFFERRILPLQPDMVIYYEANNEFAHDTRRLAEETGLLAPAETNMPKWAKTLSRYSLLFNLGYKNLRIGAAKGDAKRGKLERIPPELTTSFVDHLGKLHDELKLRDIPLILSCFLVKYRRDQDRATQIANADVSFYYMPWMTIDALLDAVDLYNDAIVRFGRQRGIFAIEDRTSLPPDSKHFADCIHFADEGCARMAERMARGLEESGYMGRLLSKARNGNR